jgi:Fic family protein
MWNWQQADWPKFTYDKAVVETMETTFQHRAGELHGAMRHVEDVGRNQLVVELISQEALTTSAIEGDILNRDSLQSSIRRHFNLDVDNRRIPPAEQGIADVLVDVYRRFDEPLSHDMLCQWHDRLLAGKSHLRDIGRYRTDPAPMQVVSGRIDRPTIHYEAPPASQVDAEMDRFIAWFNDSRDQADVLPLACAALTHLYFVSVHPFDDGNGRLARAIAEMSLSQSLGRPTLISLSQTIQTHRGDYYTALERNNHTMDVTGWVQYFADTVLAAQTCSLGMIDFLITKTRFYDQYRGQMNERQAKVVERMLREGPREHGGGFKGGLSARNYVSITGTSTATATRDLSDLAAKGVILRTGEHRGTRYWLAIDSPVDLPLALSR